jgi:hypothetical protein
LKGSYPYLRGDGVPVAQPLFQEEGSGSIPTSPLQLRFEKIDVPTACSLVALWHSRLPNITPVTITMGIHAAYVAIYDGHFYATAIWSPPVARLLWDADRCLELRRMAVSDQAPTNTASRMLGFMVRDIKKVFPSVVRLLSYQDTEVHKGTIYKATGWLPVHTTGGDDWVRPNRSRNATQSDAIKVRWEKVLA